MRPAQITHVQHLFVILQRHVSARGLEYTGPLLYVREHIYIYTSILDETAASLRIRPQGLQDARMCFIRWTAIAFVICSMARLATAI